MLTLRPVFTALNSTFGREATKTLVKIGTNYFTKENKRIEKKRKGLFKIGQKTK